MKSFAMGAAYWIALALATVLALLPLLPLWERSSQYRGAIENAVVLLPVLSVMALAYRSSLDVRKRILAVAAVGVAINIVVGIIFKLGQTYRLFGLCTGGPCMAPPTLGLLPTLFHLDGAAAWDARNIESWTEAWLACVALLLFLRFAFRKLLA
jgi:hypothetical protein